MTRESVTREARRSIVSQVHNSLQAGGDAPAVPVLLPEVQSGVQGQELPDLSVLETREPARRSGFPAGFRARREPL